MSPSYPWPGCPLVVAYGLGVNSTAMLVEFAARGIRPDLVLFADTGGEKPETYRYLAVIRPFLARAGFPDVTVVRYRPTRAAYHTLEEQCLHTRTLPSLAYGGKSCSLKYKRTPQDDFILQVYPEPRVRQAGGRVVRALGYDAGERRRVVKALGIDAGEGHRVRWQTRPPAEGQRLSRDQRLDRDYFAYWYPLLEWGYDRQRCIEVIEAACLPVPMKSACFFCPASKRAEILWLREHHPELLARALEIEHNAEAGLTTVKGLGRSFSWRRFLETIEDLPLFGGDCCGAKRIPSGSPPTRLTRTLAGWLVCAAAAGCPRCTCATASR
jgi:hypothetical protein